MPKHVIIIHHVIMSMTIKCFDGNGCQIFLMVKIIGTLQLHFPFVNYRIFLSVANFSYLFDRLFFC